MPKISIVLPVYNGADYLSAAIQSVLAQTFTDFELIIIDDCSTDETPAIAKEYLTNPKVVYYRNEHNLKLPASLNKGFELARGEYWTWTSCDNEYKPNALAQMVQALDSDPELGLVYADMQLIDAAGKEHAEVVAGPADDMIFRNVVGACFLYRSDVAKKVGCYAVDLFLCEDYEYWIRMALASKVKPINQNLYLYRTHEKSLSHVRKKEVIAKGIAMQKDYYEHFIDTREKAARFYAFLRARDIYNPWRNFYIFWVLFYSPIVFFKELSTILTRRWRLYAQG